MTDTPHVRPFVEFLAEQAHGDTAEELSTDPGGPAASAPTLHRGPATRATRPRDAPPRAATNHPKAARP
jgi:hypothetical protein